MNTSIHSKFTVLFVFEKQEIIISLILFGFAQSAEAVEYIDCTSAEV